MPDLSSLVDALALIASANKPNASSITVENLSLIAYKALGGRMEGNRRLDAIDTLKDSRVDAGSARLRMSLQSCFAIASKRHRLASSAQDKQDWGHIARFCAEAGVVPAVLLAEPAAADRHVPARINAAIEGAEDELVAAFAILAELIRQLADIRAHLVALSDPRTPKDEIGITPLIENIDRLLDAIPREQGARAKAVHACLHHLAQLVHQAQVLYGGAPHARSDLRDAPLSNGLTDAWTGAAQAVAQMESVFSLQPLGKHGSRSA